MHALTRRMIALAAAVITVHLSGVMAHAAETQLPCLPADPSCVVVVVNQPGEPGSPGSQTGGGSGKPDPCVHYPSPLYESCVGNKGLMCLDLYDKYVGVLAVDDLNAILEQNSCPPVPPGRVPPNPATLANQAADGFVLPSPSGHRSPPESKKYDGVPYTWVNLWTYFWTSTETWKPMTAMARVGPVWATVTAAPISLTFDPGDGSALVDCVGPGRPWTEADGDAAPADGACGYQYLRVTSAPITSTQTITWELTWVGSGNTSGRLTQRMTSTNGGLNVMQVQTVAVR